MNIKRRILLLTMLLGCLMASPSLVTAQEVQTKRVEKTVLIGNKQFYMHHVKAGETLYGIAKVYCVSEQDITAFNPEVKDKGLQAGMVIGIPYVAETECGSQETEDGSQKTEDGSQKAMADTIVEVGGKRYVMHYVKAGETVWGLSQTFHVAEEEILAKNPEIKDGLKAGMVVGIPYVEKTEGGSQKTEDTKPVIKPQKPQEAQKPQEPQQSEKPQKPQELEKPQQPVVESPTQTIPPLTDADEYMDGYVIHTVQKSEKTKAMLRAWNVSEEEFRQLNPSVGSRVFVGQKVLIPYQLPAEEPVAEIVPENLEPNLPLIDEVITDDDKVEVLPIDEDLGVKLVYSGAKPSGCQASRDYSNETFNVALMVPLYLGDIDKIDASRDRAEKTKKSRSLRFLQFYEGFKMAADSLTDHYGLNLNLTVLDVTENTSGAEAAVEKLKDKDVDLIIGPFFSKSFAVVQEYASKKGVMVVNPLSERESVVVDASNVLKLKPSMSSMVTELADLIRIKYPKSKVTLITPSKVKDSLMVESLENALSKVVQPEVQLSNAEMLELIARESRRRKMGKRVLSNLEVEGQIFSTKTLEAHPDDMTYFENHFQHITYSDNELKNFREGLSSARDNVLVAYGDDLVFATKVLNTVNKSARKYPITLIGLPNWAEFENLLVQNLLNMNAIYFDDHFVNYNDSTVIDFVYSFRKKYDSEPEQYAFEGFDVGWYFLNALMDLGPNPMECLPYYHQPMLHSDFYFNKMRNRDGLENRYWNVYQFDNHDIELKPVMIYREE